MNLPEDAYNCHTFLDTHGPCDMMFAPPRGTVGTKTAGDTLTAKKKERIVGGELNTWSLCVIIEPRVL